MPNTGRDDLRVLCLPCLWGKHDLCMGAITFCECLTEVMLEAEGTEWPRSSSP